MICMGFKLAVTKHIRIEVRDRDHEPAHIHVIGPGGAEAVYVLEGLELKYCKGFTRNDMRKIEYFIAMNIGTLMEAWNEIHR
jgi:hypothetical protein